MLSPTMKFISKINNINNDAIDEKSFSFILNIKDDEAGAWQIRIASFPSLSAIKEVAAILVEVFHGFNIDCLALNDFTQQKFEDLSHDAIVAKLEHSMLDKGFCKKVTLEQWRHLLLRAWKALQSRGIQPTYLVPPIGEQEILTEVGLCSPFSYIWDKSSPTHTQHESHITTGLTDPLHGLKISRQDLVDYEIDVALIEKEYKQKVGYQSEQLAKSKKDVANLLMNVRNVGNRNIHQELYTVFYTLNLAMDVAQKIAYIKSNKAFLTSAANYFPRQSVSTLNKIQEVDAFLSSIDLICADNTGELLNFVECFGKLVNAPAAPGEIVNTINNFYTDQWYAQYLSQIGIGLQDIPIMVAACPALMQFVLKKLMYIRYEEVASERMLLRSGKYEQEKVEEGKLQLAVVHYSRRSKQLDHFITCNKLSEIAFLNLSYMDLDEKDVPTIISIIQQYPNLIHCNLTGNKISEKSLEKIETVLQANRLKIAYPIYLNIYQPEANYLYIEPIITEDGFKAFPQKGVRRKNAIEKIIKTLQIDDKAAENLFERVDAIWLKDNYTALPNLLVQKRSILAQEIYKQLLKTQNKTGIFDAKECKIVTTKYTKKFRLHQFAAKMFNFYQQNGGENCPKINFIQECIKCAREAEKHQPKDLSWVSSFIQYHADVDKFYRWLRAIHPPEEDIPNLEYYQKKVVYSETAKAIL